MREAKTESSFVIQLAGRVEADFCQIPGQRLPSVRNLRHRYHTSVNSVGSALKLLEKRGVIEGGVRRRYRVIDEAQSEAEIESFDSAEQLYRSILEGVADGTYPVNVALPKIAFFTVETGLNRYQIGKVLERLLRKGVIHRRGNRYLPGKVYSTSSANRKTKIVCVVLRHSRQWELLWKNLRVWRFLDAFVEEAERFYVQIQAITLQDHPHQSWEQSLDQFLQKFSQIKDQVIGFLLPGRNKPVYPVVSIARKLAPTKLPIVWLDDNDSGLPEKVSHKLFSRFYYSEPSMVKTATDYIRDSGHTRCLFVAITQDPWAVKRAEAIRKQLVTDYEGNEVWFVLESDASWSQPRESGYLKKAESLLQSGPERFRDSFAFLESQRKEVVDLLQSEEIPLDPELGRTSIFFALMELFRKKNLPDSLLEPVRRFGAGVTLYPILENAGTTLVIAQNDLCAKSLLFELFDYASLRVPDDVSLVSFDNRVPGSIDVLDTVDPGFGYLGYQAFHRFLGSLSQSQRATELPAKAKVIVRGSVKLMR